MWARRLCCKQRIDLPEFLAVFRVISDRLQILKTLQTTVRADSLPRESLPKFLKYMLGGTAQDKGECIFRRPQATARASKRNT